MSRSPTIHGLILSCLLPAVAWAQGMPDILDPMTDITLEVGTPPGIGLLPPQTEVILLGDPAHGDSRLRVTLWQKDSTSEGDRRAWRFGVADADRARVWAFLDRTPFIGSVVPLLHLCRTGQPLDGGPLVYQVVLPGHGGPHPQISPSERVAQMHPSLPPCTD